MVNGAYHQGEAYALVVDLTPFVSGGGDPSFPAVGRYYDAYPVKPGGVPGEKPYFLVS